MDWELLIFLMEENMKENGKTIKDMEKESSIFKPVLNFWHIGKIMKKRMESIIKETD